MVNEQEKPAEPTTESKGSRTIGDVGIIAFWIGITGFVVGACVFVRGLFLLGQDMEPVPYLVAGIVIGVTGFFTTIFGLIACLVGRSKNKQNQNL